MFVVVTGKYGLEDTVGISMVSNHDVLLPTASAYRETAIIVSVEISDMAFPEMKCFGRDLWERG